MKNIKIILPEDKIELVSFVAKRRNEKEQRFGALTYGGVRESFSAHEIGAMGEVAVAHYFNVPIDLTIYDNHGDNGSDFLDIPGYGCTQVKATSYTKHPWLRVPCNGKIAHIQTFFLCSSDLNTKEVYIVGWATHEETTMRGKQRLVTNGPLNYVVYNWELHGFEKKNELI